MAGFIRNLYNKAKNKTQDIGNEINQHIIQPAENQAFAVNQKRIDANKYLSNNVGLNRNLFSGDVTRNTVNQFNPRGSGIVGNAIERSYNQLDPMGYGIVGNAINRSYQPSLNSYFYKQIIQPIQQGSIKVAKTPGFMNKVEGGLDVLRGGLNATPLGMAGNAVIAATSSTAQAIRTGQANPFQAINNNQQSSEGLGLKGIAGGVVDFGANTVAFNPKGAVAGLKNLGNLSKDAGLVKNLGVLGKSAKNILMGEDRAVGKNLVETKPLIKNTSNNYFDEASQAAKNAEGGKAKNSLVENVVDPYASIKYKPGTTEHTASYLSLNTEMGKARYNAEETLLAHNDILSQLKGTKEKQAYEQLRQLNTMNDNLNRGLVAPLSKEQIASEILRIQSKTGNRFPVIQSASEQSTKMFNGLLESIPGITPETKQAFLDANPNYAPMRSVPKDMNTPQVPGSKPINQVNKSSLKGRTGTTGYYRPDQVNVEREAIAQLTNARHKQNIVDTLAQEYGTPVGIREDAGNPMLPGAAQKLYATLDQIPHGMVELPARTSDGKIYAVPQKIADIVTDTNKQSDNMIVSMLGKGNKLFRAGATTNRIPFIVTNPQKDIINYGLNRKAIPLTLGKSGGGKINLMQELAAIPHGIASSFRDTFGVLDDLAKAQKEGGGEYGGAFGSVVKEVKLPWSVQSTGEKINHTVGNAISLPARVISGLGQFTENIPRRAEVFRNLASGASKEESALAGLDVTANFGRITNAMKPVNQMIPFLNANVQGNYSTYSAFKKSPLTFLARVGAYVVAPTVGLKLYNDSTGRNDQVDQTTKDNYLYFILPTNTTNSAGQTVPVLLKFRKADFASNLSNIIMSAMDGKGAGEQVKDIVKDLPNNVMNTLTPPVVKAPLEYSSNFNFFTKNPIVPRSNQGLTPAYQTSAYTSNTFRAIGEKFNISPAKMEQAVKDLYPSINQITDITDRFVNPQNPKPADRRLALEKISSYLPLIGVPRGDTDTVNKIYDALTVMSQENATNNYKFKQALVSGDDTKARDLSSGMTAQTVSTLMKSSQAEQDKLGMDPVTKSLQGLSYDQIEELKTQVPGLDKYLTQDNKSTQQSSVVGSTVSPVSSVSGISNSTVSANKPSAYDLAKTKSEVEQDQQTRKIGDTYVYYNPDTGLAQLKTEGKINSEADSAQLTIDIADYKRAGDYKSWLGAKQKQYDAIQAEIDSADPTIDKKLIIENRNKLNDIKDEVGKYKGYGSAFKKPKKAPSVKSYIPNISVSRIKTNTIKNIRVKGR